MVTLAAADIPSVAVYRKPQVALIATGDELVAPGMAVHDQTRIPESISFGLEAMICQHGGFVEQKYLGKDSADNLEPIAGEAIKSADLVVVIGGASVGDRDFAKQMFEAFGLKLLFEKVAIKPGKPVWLGRAKGCWVLGLPGNPTSAMVTARLFLVPILGLLQGQQVADMLDWQLQPSTGSFPAAGDRTTFSCAGWRGQGLAPVGSGDSGGQFSLADSEWLVKQRANSSAAEPNSQVRAIRF
jgi:molybdopterin molybdotransferase